MTPKTSPRRSTLQGLEHDRQYFSNYAGRKKRYKDVWKDHSYAEEVVAQFSAPGAPRLKRLVVLGTATGEILRFFDKKLGLRPFGCEVNTWAFQQIPLIYRKRIKRCDMRAYVDKERQHGRRADLCFSNSMIYLEPQDVKAFLPSLAKFCRYLHFNSSFKGRSCPDPYRKTTESYSWWNQQFKKAGFKELRGPRGHRTYLWESTQA